MIAGYKTANEIAQKWTVSSRWIRTMCSSGKIDGAVKFGNEWAILEDATRPDDGRITSGKYKNWRKAKVV